MRNEEYLRALEGFDEEVYYFSLSRRHFKPSRADQIAYLEPFLELAPDSPLALGLALSMGLPRDAEGLAEAVIRLLRDKEFAGRIAGNAFRTMKQLYSLDSIVPAYLELYRAM